MPDEPLRPTLDPAFLALLRCPLSPTRPPLTLSDDGERLRCLTCDCPEKGHEFPFTDGFPDLRPITTSSVSLEEKSGGATGG